MHIDAVLARAEHSSANVMGNEAEMTGQRAKKGFLNS
jgi:hypothetical protein